MEDLGRKWDPPGEVDCLMQQNYQAGDEETIKLDADQINTSLLEQALRELAGIRGARVVASPAGIESVRVLVIPERSTPGAIEDIISVVKRHGGHVEHDAIQVMRVGEAGNGTHRRRLSSIQIARSDERFTARVALELRGDVLVGESETPSGRRFEHRSMASATLDGVRRMLNLQVELESVNIFELGSDRLASVVLNVEGDFLVGSAMVRMDEYDAIARATLDALNRVISRAYAQQSS